MGRFRYGPFLLWAIFSCHLYITGLELPRLGECIPIGISLYIPIGINDQYFVFHIFLSEWLQIKQIFPEKWLFSALNGVF